MTLVLFGLLALWFGCAISQDEMGYYSHRYDHVNVDEILGSKRLVRYYTDCLINLKPCSPEGKALKRILPEALRTKCARCTEHQKKAALKILKTLRSDYRNDWDRLISRWDPSGDLTRSFEVYLEKERFNDIPKGVSSTPPGWPDDRPLLLNRFGDSEGDASDRTSSIRPPARRKPSHVPKKVTTMSPPRTRLTYTTTPPTVYIAPTTERRKPPMMNLPQEPQDNVIAGDSSLLGPEVTTITRSQRPVIDSVSSNRIPNFAYPSSISPKPNPVYSNTVGLIDLFGHKIIRTTNLVTDLLKNTVRVVADVMKQ